eukprot:m.442199 g.442199  ORF g.442199 m.442199 type:complete len:215 (-) comp18765_c0_seq1:70-714(-)
MEGSAARKVELAAPAYIKMMLHAAKYPTASVNGVFLGRVEAGKAELLDTVPLFHSPLNLTAMLEVAFLQLDGYCSANRLQIMGYYQAHEHVDKTTMDAVFSSIANQITANNGSAVGILIDNKDFSAEGLSGGNGFKVFFPVGDKKWHLWSQENSGADEKGFEVRHKGDKAAVGKNLVELLRRGMQDELVDFDGHLDDVSLDILNPTITKHITES